MSHDYYLYLLLSIFPRYVELICSYDYVRILRSFSTWPVSTKVLMVEEIYHANAISKLEA